MLALTSATRPFNAEIVGTVLEVVGVEELQPILTVKNWGLDRLHVTGNIFSEYIKVGRQKSLLSVNLFLSGLF